MNGIGIDFPRGIHIFWQVFELEITADLPASTQFLSPRLYMNNWSAAAAVVYDCTGVYADTDY